jgi:hypothetical protein
MSYVIYNTSSTRIVQNRRTRKERYATEASAKSALTRMSKKDDFDGAEHAVSESGFYRDNIELMITSSYINPHSGKSCTITQSINTPMSCDPTCETYWSM